MMFDSDTMASYYLDDAMMAHEEDDERSVSCRYCGKDGFHWVETKTGWRLFDAEGELHNCAAYGKKEQR
jgi:hypothetical protein